MSAVHRIACLNLVLAIGACERPANAAQAPVPPPPGIAALAISTPSAPAPKPPATKRTKEQSVRRLLEVTGAAKMGDQVFSGMLDHFKKMPNLPQGFIETFRKRANTNELLEMIVPVYMNHLDQSTMEAAITFYESPEGIKLITKQPLLVQESMQIGQKWGQDLALKVMQELQASQ